MSSGDPLLQPFQLKHLTLRNRIMSPAHEPAYAEDGKPKLRYQLYQEEKAKGGIALSMFGGSTNVAPDSPPIFGQLYAGDDDIIPWFQQLADRMHAHGTATMVQLTHLGRRTVWDDGDWLPTISASSVREPAHRSFPKEMEEADIRRVVTAFAEAARRCKEGGLDGLEVEAYGHLIDQFWSPLVNGRGDRYGGSLDNRMRFSIEVLEAIRAAVGDDFIVGIRMTGGEDVAGGLTETDGVAIASTLARTGTIDFINIIKGSIATDEAISHVIPGMGTPLGPALEFAGRFRERVNLPIFHANRIADVATARYAISEGLVDMVGMMRAHMADPHIVRKLEAGEADRIRACVGASYCINRLYLGLDSLCIQNVATGREETIPQLITAERRSATTGRRRGRRTGRPGGRQGGRRTWACGHPARGRARTRRPGPARRESHAPAGGPDGHRRLARRRMPSARGRPPVRHRGRGPGYRVARAGCRHRRDRRPAAPARPRHGRGPGRQHLGHRRRLRDTDPRRGAGVRRPWHGRGPVNRRAPGRRRILGRDRVARSPRRPGGHRDGLSRLSQDVLRARRPDDPDHRLVAVRRLADGRLEVELSNDYTGGSTRRTVDQVVVEHGSLPNAEVYLALVDGSTNGGELDLDAFIGGRPQALVANESGRYQLFRIGDAVSSRNIHAAIYDGRRIAMAL